MVIRDVKPFDDKQWNQLQVSMKVGATLEQAEKVADARSRAKKIPRENF